MIRIEHREEAIIPPAPTPRRPMSQRRRQAIFSENCTAHNIAPCCLCGDPVHRHEDQWIIEHKRALGLLGPDINTNCAPAHAACGLKKTAEQDLPRIAKAKRQAAAGRKAEKTSARPCFNSRLRLAARRYIRNEPP
ncbi:hypothetical protein [Mesorhizobium sp. B2-3-4]|uniref:hypothetical protein n=1 Tax=Mesorhizobium sp. B2-3-4 TaxID=2589959 RepID=UPI00112969BD|nr:hypothetical protein [Mesorhizobium sp. B2-3-4]TPM25725.1 hypothetical protein FJ967_32390 [Mesorhizobium sp. B2-3-4]